MYGEGLYFIYIFKGQYAFNLIYSVYIWVSSSEAERMAVNHRQSGFRNSPYPPSVNVNQNKKNERGHILSFGRLDG